MQVNDRLAKARATKTNIAHICEKYGHIPLGELLENTDFLKALLGTGEDKVLNDGFVRHRRYSYAKTHLDISTTEDRSLVQVHVVHSLTQRRSHLLSVDRPVLIKNDPQQPFARIIVDDADVTLRELENEIRTLLKLEHWSFTPELQVMSVRDIMDTQQSKYSVDLAIIIDNLAIYADVRIKVVLGWIDIYDLYEEVRSHMPQSVTPNRDSLFYYDETKREALSARYQREMNGSSFSSRPTSPLQEEVK